MDDRIINIILVIHKNKAFSTQSGGKKSQKTCLSEYRQKLSLQTHQQFAQLDGPNLQPIRLNIEGDYNIGDIAFYNNEKKKYEVHIVDNQIESTPQLTKEMKIANLHEDKNALQAIIKEVDHFQTERNISHSIFNADEESRLDRIRTSIKEKMPKFKDMDVKKEMQEIRILLKQQLKTSDKLLIEYQNSKIYTMKQMVGRFKVQICRSFNKEKPSKETIVDVNQSKFQEIAAYNDNGYQKRIFESSNEAKKANLHLETFKGKVNLNATGFFIGGFLNAGFGQAIGNQNQCSINGMVHTKSFSNLIFGASLKTAYHIEPAGVVVTEYFKDQFHNIYRLYAAEKEKVKKQKIPFDQLQQITQKIKAIINRFGSQVEVGSYVFGSTFKAIQNYTFHKSLQKQKIQQICNKESNLTLKGTGTGVIVAGSGLAQKDKSLNSGNQKIQSVESKGYSVQRQYFSDPLIFDYHKWLQAIEYNMEPWRLQFSHTQKVSVGRIMQNPQNKTKQKDEGSLFQGFCQLFDTAANDIYRQEKPQGKKDSSSEIICVVGKTGQGKSTFVNQMVGISLVAPCQISHSVKSFTSKIGSYPISSNFSNIQTTIIDTPGIFDNMYRGQNMREQIINIVYSDNKHGKIKYVDAIIMMVKVQSKLLIGKQLEEVESIFGNQIYQSLLIILNFPDYKAYESKFKECLTIEDLLRIKKVKNTKFDLENQVYYNVKQDPDTPQYRAHQREILKRVRSLKIFTSRDYEKGATERQKAIRLTNQKKLEQKEDNRMKQKVLYYMDKEFIGCTIRYPIHGVAHHLNYCVIKRTFFWIPIQRGFDLRESRSRLSLCYRKVDYEKGTIECKLYATAQRQKFLAKNKNESQCAQGLLGYNQSGDTICIQFLRGSKGLVEFCFSTRDIEQINISFKDSLPKRYICRKKEWEKNWKEFYYRTEYGIVHSENATQQERKFKIIREV